MSFEIVLLPAMMIVGPELQTTWVNNECMKAIPAFWQKIKDENIVSKIPNNINPDTIYGLYTNYSSDFSLSSGTYSFVIGCSVANDDIIPEGMVSFHIPETKYAVFTAKGPLHKSVPQIWMEIWQNKEIDRAFTYDFERYDSKSTDDENSIVKIYIAIK